MRTSPTGFHFPRSQSLSTGESTRLLHAIGVRHFDICRSLGYIPEPFSPPILPGYRQDITWDSDILFDPIAVYTTAIRLMYGLGQQPWSSPVELSRSGLGLVSDVAHTLAIYTTFWPETRTPNSDFTTQFAVRALFRLVNSMASSQPGFVWVRSSVYKSERLIGKIMITDIPDNNITLSGSVNGSMNLTSLNTSLIKPDSSQQKTRRITIKPLTANSGEIHDPADSRFLLTYKYNPNPIPAQEILSAAFSGLAQVAQYNDDGPCRYITAVSTSQKTFIHIGAVHGEVLLGWHISRAFWLLIFGLFLEGGRWEGLAFEVMFYDSVIAEGYVYKGREVERGSGTGWLDVA